MRRTKRTMGPLWAYLLAMAAVAATFAALGGCGVKSAPVPPEEARPEAIKSLRASPASDGIMLTWERPMLYAGGNTMRDLGGFVIMRAEGNTAQMQPLVEIPVTDQERFQVQHTFTYLDGETAVGASYRYAVIAETADGYHSDPSDVVDFTRIVPPPPPNPNNFHLPTPSPLPAGPPP